MKKFTSIFAILMVCLICALSFTGCDIGLDGRYKTVEAYLENPTVKSSLEESMGSVPEDIDIEIIGTTNELIYQYTFEETYDAATVELLKSSFEGSVDSLEASMVDIANSLKDCVSANNLCVVVKYLNGDGTVIFEKTFNSTN